MVNFKMFPALEHHNNLVKKLHLPFPPAAGSTVSAWVAAAPMHGGGGGEEVREQGVVETGQLHVWHADQPGPPLLAPPAGASAGAPLPPHLNSGLSALPVP